MTIINKQQIAKIEVSDATPVENYTYQPYIKPKWNNLWTEREEGYYPPPIWGHIVTRDSIAKLKNIFELDNVLYYYPKVTVTYISGEIESFYRPSMDSAKELANSLGFGVNFYNIN